MIPLKHYTKQLAKLHREHQRIEGREISILMCNDVKCTVSAEGNISCTYKEFGDIYGFWVKRQYRSLYYSGFRCEKPSEYYAAVFDIQFLSRKPFHHHKRGGMQRQGGY